MSPRVSSKAEVVARLREHEAEIRALGVRRLALFGSFTRGQVDDNSDVDLLVDFEPNRKSFDTFMRLAELLETLVGRPVELVTVEALSPYIGPRILREAEDVVRAA